MLGRYVNAGVPVAPALSNLVATGWWLLPPGAGGGKTLFDLRRKVDIALQTPANFKTAADHNGHPCFGVPSANAQSASTYAVASGYTAPTAFTISGWFRATGLGTGQFGFNVPMGFTPTSGANYCFLAVDSSGTIYLYGNGSGDPAPYTVAGYPTDGRWHHLGLVRTGNSGSYFIYLDGKQLGTTASGTGFSGVPTLTWFGRRDGGSGLQNWDGYGSDFRYYASRALSAQQVKDLYLDGVAGNRDAVARWSRRAWLGAVAASSPVTVTPGPAALVATKYAPAVSTPRTTTPGVASLVTTKYAPAVSTPRLATIGNTSLTTTKYAPVVLAPRTATPGVLSLTTTKYAPVVLTPRLVTPGVAALATTGYAPAVTAGSAQAFVPATAGLVLTKYGIVVSTPRLATPDVRTLTISRFAPTIVSPRLVTPGVAVLTLTSFAPVALAPRTASPGAASLAATTYSSVVSTPRVVAPATAGLTTTGFAPAALVPTLVEVQLAPGLTVVGYSPLVYLPVECVPGTAALACVVYAPDVTGTEVYKVVRIHHLRGRPDNIALVRGNADNITTGLRGRPDALFNRRGDGGES